MADRNDNIETAATSQTVNIVSDGSRPQDATTAGELALGTDDGEENGGNAETIAADTNPDAGGDTANKGWFSKASLYCRVNGRCHATLLDFGYQFCNQCQGDLSQPRNLDLQLAGTNNENSGNPDPSMGLLNIVPTESNGMSGFESHAPNSNENPAPIVVQDVSYFVEYYGKDRAFMEVVSWDGNFDLSTARQGVKQNIRQNTNSIFEVVTILETSAPARQNWYTFDQKYMMLLDILKDPYITITKFSTRLNIHSTLLIQLFRRSISYYPTVYLNGGLLQMEEPFPLIAHHYRELEHYRATYDSQGVTEEDDEAVAVKHLGLLLDYFQKSSLQDILDEEAHHAKDICTFRMLWLLYKPGTTVYLESEGQLSAFVVQSVSTDAVAMSTFSSKRPRWYNIVVWNLNYNGRCVGRTSRTVTVAPFEGERSIMSLRLIPCRWIDKYDNGKTRQRLEELGKRWYELLPGGQVYYSGPLPGARQRQLHTRVYIDSASFYGMVPQQAPTVGMIQDFDGGMIGWDPNNDPNNGLNNVTRTCQCEECRGLRSHPPDDFPWTRYDILDPTMEKDLNLPGASEGPLHRYLLCDHLLHGFDLKSRKWVSIDVAYCKPAKTNAKAIDTLVMPTERKDMIKALVRKFTNTESNKGLQRSWAADFIENKGEGQIFLLHGSPGVGKTYVKCIAEYTGRPLLSLTCGDIGTDEVQMETQLSSWFQLAEKWGAVVLIDEADVYLERRLITDLKRNSLVSVFLRCIEYYRGVLFLTTNRVGHFDDAFISRIHVIIRYDNLSADDRRKIWSQFFDKLDDEREDFRTTQRAKDYVLEDGNISNMEWNGREIRNAFQTAVALAEFRFLENQDSSKHKQPTLDQKNFEQVCNMMQQFKRYLNDVHGADEEERAFYAKSRAGRYSSVGSK